MLAWPAASAVPTGQQPGLPHLGQRRRGRVAVGHPQLRGRQRDEERVQQREAELLLVLRRHEPLEEAQHRKHMAGLDDEARIATARPCPLLVDRRCSVYEDRPLACRSLTSPNAAQCHQAMSDLDAGRGVTPIEIYPVLRFLCSGEHAATRGICRDLGLQDDFVELSQAVADIIRDPTLIERWAAGERVFSACAV